MVLKCNVASSKAPSRPSEIPPRSRPSSTRGMSLTSGWRGPSSSAGLRSDVNTVLWSLSPCLESKSRDEQTPERRQ
ncbi:hypothetical protein NHX12_028930 [Muraenolepis orangiensis]|uniref:Uncharacterized protein n=1 Tax=Muraenolepis orangiensis TaxID=630683 RepID=A0A9Q0EB67_9TELE|nr:hypothetical protein NHX12_028930 [Muraenolepis orangiensis]